MRIKGLVLLDLKTAFVAESQRSNRRVVLADGSRENKQTTETKTETNDSVL